MDIKNASKKVKVSKLVNILLVVTLVLVIAFGWWYLKGRSPIETARTVLSNSLPKPEYLYTIYGPEKKPLRKPSSTYVHEDKIYVTDTENSRVIVFDYSGKFLFEFGKPGTHEGAMVAPVDLLIRNDEIYVVDNKQGIIMVHDMEGKFKRVLGSLKFVRPISITFSGDKFYVLDTGNMTVNILDENGKFIKLFGKQGNGEGEFYFPDGLAVKDDKIYVADTNNNRIQIFDLEGKFLQVWLGKDSKGSGGYSIPRDIAFDNKGNLYTAEMLSNLVSITNEEGINMVNFSYAEPMTENIEDQIRVPVSVTIDNAGRLYVTENGKSRILVYQIK